MTQTLSELVAAGERGELIAMEPKSYHNQVVRMVSAPAGLWWVCIEDDDEQRRFALRDPADARTALAWLEVRYGFEVDRCAAKATERPEADVWPWTPVIRSSRATPKPTGEGCVYFIQAGLGPIKIGWATNPTKRLRTLQTGTCEELRLLGVIKSSRAASLEGEIHRRFASARIRGEWFDPVNELIAFIADPQ